MKKRTLIFLIITVIFVFTGCRKKQDSTAIINIASLKGPTSIGLVKLYTDSDDNKTELKYNYSICATADEIATMLIKGELDAAAIPANLAAILNKKTDGKVRIAGINTLGVLYILTKGTDISDIAELKGTTIYSTGQGTTPEYTLRHILSSNGLDPDKDVNIEYYKEASEIASKMVSEKSAIAMLPEPYVEVVKANDANVKVALSLNDEWHKIHPGSNIVTGVIVVSEDFINNNRKAFDTFMKEYRTSTEYTKTNTNECADLVEKLGIFKASVAKKAIPDCNIVFINDKSVKQYLDEYFGVLFEENKASVGGQLPSDDAYFLS